MTVPERKPVPVKRSRPGEEPVKIPTMAQRKRPSCLLIGLLLLLVVGLTVSALWYFEVINFAWFQPANTLTATLPAEKASSTFTPTKTLTSSPQPSLTATSTATATSTQTPTATITPTPTEKPMPYVVKGTPGLYPDTLFFSGYGCGYLFIGGEVLDLQDAPVKDLNVHLGGYYGASEVDQDSLTGSVSVYGPSGYGFILTNLQIIESRLYLQLEDADGNPLSGIVYLEVSDSCDQNLMLINFKQVR